MATAEYAVTSLAGTSHESSVHGSMPLNVQSVIGQPIIDVNGLNGDSSDSRKRPLETMDSEFEMGLTKRSNVLLGPGKFRNGIVRYRKSSDLKTNFALT